MRWLQILVPLLLPTVAYIIWVKLRNAQAGTPADVVPLSKGPWIILVASGLVLMMASLGLLAAFGERIPAGEYVPPRLENDRVVPAHRAPAE